ncbi:MAG: Gfo/Idh/MocA family oxidoreductase [Opitutaceae bacterium]|jgi:predicted dehydrogenase
MNLKFCMIGCGGHAYTAHGPAQQTVARNLPGFQLAACCDRDPVRAATYARDYGFARHYTDIDTMLAREQPDAVALVLPVEIVCEIAAPLLARGVPLLLEKPPGLNREELEQLIAAAETGGAPHLVGFNRRFMPIIARARELLDTEFIRDEPRQITYELIRFNRRDPDFSTTAIHGLDTGLFLAGSPFKTARMGRNPLPHLGPNVASLWMEAECVSGTRLRWNMNPVAGLITERIAIHGIGRSLLLELPVRKDDAPGSLSFWRNDREILREAFTPPDQEGFAQETAAFAESLVTGNPTGPHLCDCRQQIDLMEALRAQRPAIQWQTETTPTSALEKPLSSR